VIPTVNNILELSHPHEYQVLQRLSEVHILNEQKHCS
jgi:hypothetical protein